MRAWLAPRPVRFYPEPRRRLRVAPAPPPHLVGLRVAALDALLGRPPRAEDAPVVVVSAVALAEKVPDPALRPPSFAIAKGDLLDLDEVADAARRAPATSASTRSTTAASSRSAAGSSTSTRRPRTAPCRVDLFDIEVESLRWFSTFTQRSLGETERVEIAPAAELAAEHRELAEIAALLDEDEDRARTSPSCCRSTASGAFLDLAPGRRAACSSPPRRRSSPALADHWQDVCAAFHDDDAHHLYVKPDDDPRGARRARRASGSRSLSADQPLELRAQAADVAARSLKRGRARAREARALGLPHGRRLAAPRRRRARRLQPRAARRREWLDGDAGAASAEPQLAASPRRSLRDGFIAAGLKLAVLPEHRLFRRRRAERTGGMDAAGRRRGALRSFADLRTGDIVVHEDHGLARFAGFDTKTVGGVTRDYLELEFAGTDKVFMPVDQLAKISRYVGAGGAHPPLSQARRQVAGRR